MPTFRQLPIEVEARQFVAAEWHIQKALALWCDGELQGIDFPAEDRVIHAMDQFDRRILISVGDWIILWPDGTFTRREADLFALTFGPC